MSFSRNQKLSFSKQKNMLNLLKRNFIFGTFLIFTFSFVWMISHLSVINELHVLNKSKLFVVSRNRGVGRKIYSDEWLTLSPKNISDYGDGTCKQSPYVPKLQTLFRSWDTFAKQHDIMYALHAGSLLAA